MANKKVSQGLKRAQSRLLNQNTKKILNNVLLLYVVLIASIADLLYIVSTGSHINVIVFILVAYVTSLFSKNMTVVFLCRRGTGHLQTPGSLPRSTQEHTAKD